MCHLAQYVLQTLPEDVAVVVFQTFYQSIYPIWLTDNLFQDVGAKQQYYVDRNQGIPYRLREAGSRRRSVESELSHQLEALAAVLDHGAIRDEQTSADRPSGSP